MANDDRNPLADYQVVTEEQICDVLRIRRRDLERIMAGDAAFPKPLLLPGVTRWLLSEVEQWIELQKSKE
ncbi:MAG TPA: hypothetical protein VM867_08250 [Xanthobacteraceae bacterium]|jgi:predicted DNA-binding transcriptional regulator AlpA|nr:hypothetical protein [Xanthobacteraceae bacterium]